MIPMEMVEVVSKNISAVGYDKDAKVLRIRFSSLSEYEYKDVEPSKYEEFIIAPSKGTYFGRYIKKKHEYRQVTKVTKVGGVKVVSVIEPELNWSKRIGA